MYKLGITGGIGSGKTTASLYFKKRNAFIFDSDTEAKKLLFKKEATSLIIKKFGSQVTIDGSLDLKLLSDVVFKKTEFQNSLNEIIWPKVLEQIYIYAAKAKKSGTKLFIVDAALLLEANFQNFFDSTLLITADENIRYKRILGRNNIPENQIKKRMKLQMDELIKMKMVDYTIKNNYSLVELNNKLEIFYESLKL